MKTLIAGAGIAGLAAPDGAHTGPPVDLLKKLFSSFATPLSPIIDSLDTNVTFHAGRISDAFSTRRLQRIEWVQKQSHKRDLVRSLPGPVRNFILGRFGAGLYVKSFGPLVEQI